MKRHRAYPGLLLVAGAAMLCLAARSRAADDIVYDDSAPPARAGQVWRYTGGLFAASGNGKWVQINTQGTFYFREVARGQDFIEIYDQSRDVTVRLHDQACSIRHPGTGGQFVYLYSRLPETTRQEQFPDFLPDSVPTDDGDGDDDEGPQPGR